LTLTVIKLGGSLMRCSELDDWLTTAHSLAAMSNIIFVPGGGEFADKVRETQVSLGLDDQTAHRLALLAMSQYGYYLAGRNKNLHIVEDVESLSSSIGKSALLLWLPTVLLKDESEIPASWDFTSDSIALWLATKLSANSLILVKAKAMKQTKKRVEECIKNNTLDKGFQQLTAGFHGDIHLLDKGDSQQLINLF